MPTTRIGALGDGEEAVTGELVVSELGADGTGAPDRFPASGADRGCHSLVQARFAV
jgi:hypothetical protein